MVWIVGECTLACVCRVLRLPPTAVRMCCPPASPNADPAGTASRNNSPRPPPPGPATPPPARQPERGVPVPTNSSASPPEAPAMLPTNRCPQLPGPPP